MRTFPHSGPVPGADSRAAAIASNSGCTVAPQRTIAKCQLLTRAPQHEHSLFDHLVGAAEQHLRTSMPSALANLTDGVMQRKAVGRAMASATPCYLHPPIELAPQTRLSTQIASIKFAPTSRAFFISESRKLVPFNFAIEKSVPSRVAAFKLAQIGRA